ncbi:hypothetical protein [Wolbachia endosymbiont (group B) of Gerris lacustris]|uniref:hypothetical protein n=1 Tax=Wolbachia endosymbiont (group B) of Gerris lacustris TaxID=3066159 RepID=UPI003340CD8B
MEKDDVIFCLTVLGIVASIGALTGLGLSFTALSPLVMGGIVASVLAALFTCITIYNKNFSKKSFFIGACVCAASFATGVGLAAAAVFPGATLGMGSAALAGALIAPIAAIAEIIATTCIIKPIAKKVNEYIISPIVGKCFSSKEKEQAI